MWLGRAQFCPWTIRSGLSTGPQTDGGVAAGSLNYRGASQRGGAGRRPDLRWRGWNTGTNEPERCVASPSGLTPHGHPTPGDIVGSKKFARLARDERKLGLPLAALSDDLRKALKTQVRAVQMSAATAAKQLLRRHSEVKPEDYALVQEAIHRGEVRQVDGQIHLMFEKNGKWWFSALKRTKTGDELYFSTLYRLREDSATRARRGKLLRDEVGARGAASNPQWYRSLE